MVCGLLNIMLARHFSLLIVCVFCFLLIVLLAMPTCGAFYALFFVVACVRGHLIVIVCVINNILMVLLSYFVSLVYSPRLPFFRDKNYTALLTESFRVSMTH